MRTLSVVFISAFALTACSKGGDDVAADCAAPKAIAGENVAVALGEGAQLDGTLSTAACNPQAITYTWSVEQAPVGSAADDTIFGSDNGTPDGASPTFPPDVVGSYVISLVVSDGITTSQPDIVVVTVSSDDAVPTANAGEDLTARINERVILDGSGSRDPEGAPLQYLWTLTDWPAGSLLRTNDGVYDSHSETASIVADVAGTYVVALIVSDGAHYSEPDFVTLVAGDSNMQPMADAGTSTTLAACASNTLTLNGYGSYDPDGDALTYRWWLNSAPASSAVDDSSFDDATRPNPRFSWDAVGTYSFSLQVSDGVNTSAIDEVFYTMVDESKNKSPVANAGSDQSIDAKADCTVHSYVSDCDDCEGETFSVDGSSSSDPDGDTLAFFWRESTVGSTVGPLTIVSPSSGFTEVVAPSVPATLTTGKKTTFEMTLDVSDCSKSDDDAVKLTVNCVGKKI